MIGGMKNENISVVYLFGNGRNVLCRRNRDFVRRRQASLNLLTEILIELDGLLDSKRKRHIAGGVLLSVSALFSGLAITVMTIKSEGDLYE